MKLCVVAALFIAPLSVSAQSMDSMNKAQNLGTILAAENFCGLSYNQDAIEKWISDNTDPSDMEFSGTLNMMTEGSAFMQNDMSESSKTAHCYSVKRTAQHFGFIK